MEWHLDCLPCLFSMTTRPACHDSVQVHAMTQRGAHAMTEHRAGHVGQPGFNPAATSAAATWQHCCLSSAIVMRASLSGVASSAQTMAVAVSACLFSAASAAFSLAPGNQRILSGLSNISTMLHTTTTICQRACEFSDMVT